MNLTVIFTNSLNPNSLFIEKFILSQKSNLCFFFEKISVDTEWSFCHIWCKYQLIDKLNSKFVHICRVFLFNNSWHSEENHSKVVLEILAGVAKTINKKWRKFQLISHN